MGCNVALRPVEAAIRSFCKIRRSAQEDMLEFSGLLLSSLWLMQKELAEARPSSSGTAVFANATIGGTARTSSTGLVFG